MIRLSVPDSEIKNIDREKDDEIDVKVLVLYPFFVEADNNGNSFDIKEKDVRAIHAMHNEEVRSLWHRITRLGKKIPLKDIEAIPNQKNHDQNVDSTVGHVVGEYELLEADGGPYLFANLRVKGKENVYKVKKGLWKKVSIGFDPKTHKSFEISWVMNGAIPDAQNISFSQASNIKKLSKEYNFNNIVTLKSILLSKYENNINLIRDKEIDLEIENMLINLKINSKILPVQVVRVREDLKKIQDREARLSAFNILNENMKNVIDYEVLARNNIALDVKENLRMSGNATTEKINMAAIAVGAALKKGEFSPKEPKDNNKKEADRIDKEVDKQTKSSMKFKKKDKEHVMKLAADGDMEEMGKYLSAFFSEEDMEDKDKEAKDKEEKEKAKFSKAVTDIQTETAQLKKQNEEISSQLAILSKGNEETKALFSKIIEIVDSSK